MLLAIEDFSVGFRRHIGLVQQSTTTILSNLSFGLDRGEVLALVGASGAGKSLLAHALFGILPANATTSGRMRLDGVELGPRNLSLHCGRRMGLVPQSISHLDPLARCGVQLAWAAQRSGIKIDKPGLETTLRHFGLDASAARALPHQLSGGMARRMMLAMASIGQPDLIVADEPTSGLDPDNAAIVLGHFRGIAAANRGVLLITHDLAQALPFANRVAILQHGRLVGMEKATAFAGDGDDLQSPYARALWLAMPENAFRNEAMTHA